LTIAGEVWDNAVMPNRSRDRVYLLYLLFLYIACARYFFPWPIVADDTDLWYHLTGGRYILEHHALPMDSSFISFLAPPRPFIDYYWLFQVLVYSLHSAFGYVGLIVLRNAVYVALLTVVAAYFYWAYKRTPNRSPLYLSVIFVLFMLFLFSRFRLIRPHMFSYLFIPVFILVYERYPRRTLWLPLLALLWCNLHGGEFPVMLLISGAYLAEYFVNRLRRLPLAQTPNLALAIPAALSMWAILATPHGLNVLRVPFSTAHASQYILEYMPLTAQGWVSASTGLPLPSQRTLFTLLLAAAWTGAWFSGRQRTLRISHLLLLVGGTFLSTMGNRFTYECVLLALPILAAGGPARAAEPAGAAAPRSKLVPILLGLLLILPPLTWLRAMFADPPRFPMSAQQLPEGVAAFLARTGEGGNLLNQPNKGGYLEWALAPRYKIFMDMQCPLLFTEEDLHTAVTMFANEAVLTKVLAQYDPLFLTVPLNIEQAERVLSKFPDYVLVFFDDAEALYVSRRHLPALAERYALKTLNPFRLYRDGAESFLTEANREPALREVRQLLAVHPTSRIGNHLAAVGFHHLKAYDQTLGFAEILIRNVPESAVGYALKGDALKGLGAYGPALEAYHRAMDTADGEHQVAIYRGAGETYLLAGKADQAYHLLRQAINPFTIEATPEDLFWLGAAAFRSGHTDEGSMILQFSAQKSSPDDAKWYERLREAARQ